MNELSLFEQVKEVSESFKRECDFIKCEIQQQDGKPYVVCTVSHQTMIVPKLYLSVFNGYPKVGTVTHAFGRPPKGFCGSFTELKEIFTASATSLRVSDTCRVDDWLKEWASAINKVIQKRKKDTKIVHDITEEQKTNQENVQDVVGKKESDTVSLSVPSKLPGDHSGF